METADEKIASVDITVIITATDTSGMGVRIGVNLGSEDKIRGFI
jgi:4-hydroxy-3-methylbut-2-en-1-yl diphosphate synthase IspG/GcpE